MTFSIQIIGWFIPVFNSIFVELLQQLDFGVTEREIDRSEAWLLAHRRKDGTYTPEVQQVAERIVRFHHHYHYLTYLFFIPNFDQIIFVFIL